MGSNGKPRKEARMVPGKNGVGLIKQGGVHPNGGRPRSAIKAALAMAFDERIPRLAEIADGVTEITLNGKCPKCGHVESTKVPLITTATDRLKALDIMAKHGLGSGVDPEAVRNKLARTIAVIRERFPGESGEACLDELAEIW